MTYSLIIVILALSMTNKEALHTVAPKTCFIAQPPPPAPNTGYDAWDAYIGKYKEIACCLGSSYGIPPSVILAQGILESAAGTSELFQKTRNHFCVKCPKVCNIKNHHVLWDDDHPDDKFLIFRSDTAAWEAQFKRMTAGRYTDMRNVCGDDVDKWCDELQRRGYATSDGYAGLLKSIVHELREYDHYASRESAHPKDRGAVRIERAWSARD